MDMLKLLKFPSACCKSFDQNGDTAILKGIRVKCIKMSTPGSGHYPSVSAFILISDGYEQTICDMPLSILTKINIRIIHIL